MKRKAEEDLANEPSKKKVSVDSNASIYFRETLLQQAEEYQKQYKTSEPYQHGVIQDLLASQLLRHVRTEIQESLSFTRKETDIYKIDQSGDLANLDGLDDTSLKLLPSLLTLRDALYSSDFRDFLSTVTSSGPLSGKKTDMAINVYTPGCHLLCHDDVIGSRRVSYILYLTDPDRPWKPEWGGALRLYPTILHKEDGKEIKVPSPDWSKSIPPAFNQLSFFAVQPGESFHDVEEVYACQSGSKEDGGEACVRMAISGWYHIPQEGEDGYVEGLEESLAERSSLQQLQGSGDQYDKPLQTHRLYSDGIAKTGQTGVDPNPLPTPSPDEAPWTEDEFDFLLEYIAPSYLTPDTLDPVTETFGDECSILLENFLSAKFSASLKADIVEQEAKTLPPHTQEIEESTPWRVARPPHKHRFLYQQSSECDGEEPSPLSKLVDILLPSQAFRKWLQVASGIKLSSHNLLARRFRRGKDYTLATGYCGDQSQLEIILSISPSLDSGVDENPSSGDTQENKQSEGTNESQGDRLPKAPVEPDPVEAGTGGYIAYMASDDANTEADDTASNDGVEVPVDMSTGGRASKPAGRKQKADPAIYQAAEDDEDDGVLFSMQPTWNTLGIVLRDKGVMRFTKYLSQQAKGDRWDVLGEFGIVPEEEEKEEDEAGEERGTQQTIVSSSEGNHDETDTEVESSDDD